MKEFGSEFNIECAKNDYFNKISELLNHSYYLRSGREAYSLLSQSKNYNINKTILIPAFSCWSIEFPLKSAGWQIEYYPLENNLSINITKLIKLVEVHSALYVLSINYFGFTNSKSAFLKLKIKYPNIKIIEDFTHCLFNLFEIINPNVDYYIASIRKTIGVPDGAILLSKNNVDENLIKSCNQSKFFFLRKIAQLEKSKYKFTYNTKSKELFRTKLQSAEYIINQKLSIHKMSEYSFDIINHTNIEVTSFARRENFKHLYKIISQNKHIDFPFKSLKGKSVPFSMVICVKNRDNIQKQLAENGIYASVLWPISNEAKKICKISKYMSENMLSIPIDQRYDYHDIEELGKKLNLIIS